MVIGLLAMAPPASAGSEGEIIFRLTIRGGPIPPTDAFSLAVNDETPPATIISPGFRCGPRSELYNNEFVACEPRNYDWPIGTDHFEIGDEFSYTFARGNQVLHEGTVTLRPGTQTVTVVFDYSLGQQPLVPDTTVEPLRNPVPAGVVLGLGALGASLLIALRRSRHAE